MTRIGVVGEGADAAVDGVEAAGGNATAGPAIDLAADADVDVLVALGEDALTDLVAAGAATPILPVGAGSAVESVPRNHLDAVLHDLVDDEYTTTDARLLAVAVDGETHRVLMDVMLVTNEPARISEYGIHATVDDDIETVDTVRADGVVVATPRGSHDYAKDARGPILTPGADVVSVVPIAPFRIDRVHWGLTPPMSLTVERDESDVALLVDGAQVGILDPDESVEFAWGDTLPLVQVSTSAPYFSP